MSGNMVEGQGGPGHSTHLSPSAGLSWSVQTEPAAPKSVLPTLCLCVFGVEEALRLLPAKMAAAGRLAVSFSCLSFSPRSRAAAGKVGQECLGQSSKVPTLLCSGASSPES